MSDREAFRRDIETYLNGRRISQRRFALELGYTREHASRILHGKEKMPGDFVHSAVRVLAELGCIRARGQARRLLRLMDAPDFSLDDWKAQPLAILDDTPSSDPPIVAEGPTFPQGEDYAEDTSDISTPPTRTNVQTLVPARGTLLRQYDVHASYVVAVAWEPRGQYRSNNEASQPETCHPPGSAQGPHPPSQPPRPLRMGSNLALDDEGGTVGIGGRVDVGRGQTCGARHTGYSADSGSPSTPYLSGIEPRGTRIASAGGDGTVRVWEAETGQTLLTYRGHTHWLNKTNRQITVYTVSWGPKGDRIVSAGVGADVRIWDATTGQTLTRYEGHSGLAPYVFAVAWSPDGQQIASACSSMAGLDKTVHRWDAATGQPLSRYKVPSDLMPNFSVLSLAWSPDGTRIAATCSHNVIRIWDITTGHLVSTQRGGSEWVNHIAWSPDSQYLALAQSDHKARVWDTFTEKNVTTYHEHKDSVRSVAWSPDGKALATASNDRTVHIWEPSTGKRIFVYKGHSDLTTSVDWSPDGTRIASASNDKTVHIWQAGDDRQVRNRSQQ